MSLKNEVLALRNRAWTTAASRYNAARRLRMRGKLSLGTISLLSALGVAVPLLLTSSYWGEFSEGLGVFSSILSLFILVIAVIESSAGFDAKADALFRNAELLNAFRMRVSIRLADELSCTPVELSNLTNEYEQIKASCAINHEIVDYNFHRASCPTDFGLEVSAARKVFAHAHWVLYSTWWLMLAVLAAIVGFVTVVGQ